MSGTKFTVPGEKKSHHEPKQRVLHAIQQLSVLATSGGFEDVPGSE